MGGQGCHACTDGAVCKCETELDSFVHVHRIVSDLSDGCKPQEKIDIRVPDVMAKLEAVVGYGSMPLSE